MEEDAYTHLGIYSRNYYNRMKPFKTRLYIAYSYIRTEVIVYFDSFVEIECFIFSNMFFLTALGVGVGLTPLCCGDVLAWLDGSGW